MLFAEGEQVLLSLPTRKNKLMAKLARAVKKNLTPVSYEIATGDR